MLFTNLLLAVSAASIVNAASWIVPGAEWKSTAGTKIDAHGGMVLKQGNTFYWIGHATSHSMKHCDIRTPHGTMRMDG